MQARQPLAGCIAQKPSQSAGAGFDFPICLRLALRNASGRDGAAVPQLYIHRTQGVATSRARQLVDWKKLRLRAGEGAETELSIPPEALRQWDGAAWVTPPGKIEWFLGDNGEDWASGEFTLSGTSA